MATIPAPRLLAISDRRRCQAEVLGRWLEALAETAVDAVQIREKDLPDRELLALVRKARRILPSAVRLLVNGRFDVALAGGADGVHLPSSGLPVDALRRRFGGDLLVGVSTHHLEEIERARDEGADYATFGPVWHTPSKARYGPPAGVEKLRRASEIGLPVLALGGVTMCRVAEAAAAGAAGIAAISLFLAPEPEAIAAAARHFPSHESNG